LGGKGGRGGKQSTTGKEGEKRFRFSERVWLPVPKKRRRKKRGEIDLLLPKSGRKDQRKDFWTVTNIIFKGKRRIILQLCSKIPLMKKRGRKEG